MGAGSVPISLAAGRVDTMDTAMERAPPSSGGALKTTTISFAGQIDNKIKPSPLLPQWLSLGQVVEALLARLAEARP